MTYLGQMVFRKRGNRTTVIRKKGKFLFISVIGDDLEAIEGGVICRLRFLKKKVLGTKGFRYTGWTITRLQLWFQLRRGVNLAIFDHDRFITQILRGAYDACGKVFSGTFQSPSVLGFHSIWWVFVA